MAIRRIVYPSLRRVRRAPEVELVAFLSRSDIRRVRQLPYPSLCQGSERLGPRQCFHAVAVGGPGELVVDHLALTRTYCLDYYSVVHGRNLRGDSSADAQRLEAEDDENTGGASLGVQGQHAEARYAICQCLRPRG